MSKSLQEISAESLKNQKEIIGRLRILQKQLNQIIPHPITYSKSIAEDLMNAKEAAKHLGISETQFYVRMNNGEFPVHIGEDGAGRKVSMKDLNAWITRRTK